jgi:hypothetical protein
MGFIHRPKSKILKIKKLKSRRFGSWLCFRLQVNGGREEMNTYSVGPLDRASLHHWTRVDVLLFSPSIHLKTEAESASETS